MLSVPDAARFDEFKEATTAEQTQATYTNSTKSQTNNMHKQIMIDMIIDIGNPTTRTTKAELDLAIKYYRFCVASMESLNTQLDNIRRENADQHQAMGSMQYELNKYKFAHESLRRVEAFNMRLNAQKAGFTARIKDLNASRHRPKSSTSKSTRR